MTKFSKIIRTAAALAAAIAFTAALAPMGTMDSRTSQSASSSHPDLLSEHCKTDLTGCR